MNDDDRINEPDHGSFDPVEFDDAGFRLVSVESAILLGGILIGIVAGIWHLA